MRVKVTTPHLGEGQFPTFPKSTPVNLIGETSDDHFLHWWACDIDGHSTYVPEHYLHDGKLYRDYNPTELVQQTGDVLQVREIAFAWLYATNDKGVSGWIPAEVVVSL